MSALPPDQCERIFAGEHPLKVWREHLEFEQADVRRVTKISVYRIEEIEKEKGRAIPGPEAKSLARALEIPDEALTRHHQAFRAPKRWTWTRRRFYEMMPNEAQWGCQFNLSSPPLKAAGAQNTAPQAMTICHSEALAKRQIVTA